MRAIDAFLTWLWDRSGERRAQQAERRAHTEAAIMTNLNVRKAAAIQIVRTQRVVAGRERWSR